jgi:hypothetical protein
MAVWECAECTAKYSVGAPKCPQCGSTVRVNENTQPPEEDEMAKITVHGGPSNAAADEGGEDVSAGTSSSTSSETASPSTEPSEPASPSRARGAASRSKQGRTAGSSTAGSTGGSGPETATADKD